MVDITGIQQALKGVKRATNEVAKVSAHLLLWRLEPSITGLRSPGLNEAIGWAKQGDIHLNNLAEANNNLIDQTIKLEAIIHDQIIDNPQVEAELAEIFGGKR